MVFVGQREVVSVVPGGTIDSALLPTGTGGGGSLAVIEWDGVGAQPVREYASGGVVPDAPGVRVLWVSPVEPESSQDGDLWVRV